MSACARPRYGYGVRREEITRTQGRITNTEIRALISLKAERGRFVQPPC